MNKCVAALLLTLPGIALVFVSVLFGWYIFPVILHGEIIKSIRLIEGSDTWNKWVEAPIPIYLSFYVHHVTNPNDVERGLKPVFQERGPYAYLQKRRKVDLKQENGLNTVKYREVKTYFFDKQRSGNNSEDDLVNVPNVPFVGVLHSVQKQLPLDFVTGLVGNLILLNETFIKRSVRVGDLLFEGFDVTKYTHSLLASRLPQEFSGGRFGLYKGKNGTASEEWQIYTGYENSVDFGRVKTWDGKSDLQFWRKYSECDKVKGTDGSIFPPFLTKQTEIHAYSPDICRSISLVYHSDIQHKGIPGYRFKASAWSLADPRVNIANQCFCLEDNLENCAHGGVLGLESCRNAPIWSSSPYFLGADVRYLAAANLPPPDNDLHSTFIDLEPNTGLILRAHKRLQINLGVKPYRKVQALRNINTDITLFPLIWADENAELDEALADEVIGKLFAPQQIVDIAKWALLVIGILLFLIGLAIFIVKYVMETDLKGLSERFNAARSDSVVSK